MKDWRESVKRWRNRKFFWYRRLSIKKRADGRWLRWFFIYKKYRRDHAAGIRASFNGSDSGKMTRSPLLQGTRDSRSLLSFRQLWNSVRLSSYTLGSYFISVQYSLKIDQEEEKDESKSPGRFWFSSPSRSRSCLSRSPPLLPSSNISIALTLELETFVSL